MKKLIKKFMASFPSPLPFGMAEFEVWAKDIILISNLPDNDSTRFALASAIMHYPSSNKDNTKAFSKVPKAFFGNILRKGGANQVAAGVMQQLKDKQRAAEEAAKEAAGAASDANEGPEKTN